MEFDATQSSIIWNMLVVRLCFSDPSTTLRFMNFVAARASNCCARSCCKVDDAHVVAKFASAPVVAVCGAAVQACVSILKALFAPLFSESQEDVNKCKMKTRAFFARRDVQAQKARADRHFATTMMVRSLLLFVLGFSVLLGIQGCGSESS